MRKGFSLIELIVILVVLAVIAAIVVPTVSGIISKQKENAFKTEIKSTIKSFEQGIVDEIYNRDEWYQLSDDQNFINNNYEEGTIKYLSDSGVVIINEAKSGRYRTGKVASKHIIVESEEYVSVYGENFTILVGE